MRRWFPFKFAYFAVLISTACCGGVADPGPARWDGGPCFALPPHFDAYKCDDSMNATCQSWAATVAIGGYGRSVCHEDSVNGLAECSVNPDCGGDSINGCCGVPGQVCNDGEVCASDTAQGARHCIKACLGVPSEAGTD